MRYTEFSDLSIYDHHVLYGSPYTVYLTWGGFWMI